MGSAYKRQDLVKKLFRLPFSEQRSSLMTNIDDAEEYFRKVIPTLKSMHPLEEDKTFAYKFAGISLNRVSMAATSGLQLNQSCGITEDYIITIPIEDVGNSICTIDGAEFVFSAKRGEALFFTPSENRGGLANRRSAITLRFSHQILIDTVRLMTGNPNISLPHQSKVINLFGDNYPAFRGFLKLIELIDVMQLDEQSLNLLSIDDAIMRFIALVVFPEQFHLSAAEENLPNREALDLVCDAVRARLCSPLSLSEMQLLSGLSARNLQRKFLLRFGCSPVEWQKRERLHVSRNRLLNASEDVNITNLALEVGFASTSRFIAYYKEAFGETPRQTLLQRSNR